MIDHQITVKIIIDYRELRSPVAKILERQGCELQFKTLEIGDYIVSDRVGFERKTPDDFLKSWIDDKKIFNQLHDLRSGYSRPILLVEGFQDDLYCLRRIDYRAVQGVLNTIALMGIPTLYTGSPEGTANIIAMIARKEQDENKRLPALHGKRSHMTQDEQLIYIISAIPGVGPQTAIDLLSHFRTIEKITTAGLFELTEVNGIGESTAIKIRNIVTHNYNQQ